mmetsp:Transcript_7226/g.19669  ORF Transcript_7226/g.19669 Transcript_7226/m.19669 type:complete len:820 (-) Transcript_7226:198-2657(-)
MQRLTLLALVAAALCATVAAKPGAKPSPMPPPPPAPAPTTTVAPSSSPAPVTGDNGAAASWIIAVSGVIGLLFSAFQLYLVAKIEVEPGKRGEGYTNMEEGSDTNAKLKLYEVYCAIQEGAKAFLFAEYFLMGIFVVVFGALVLVLTSYTPTGFKWEVGGCTAVSFVVGAVTSIVSGYIGMMVAVFSNARTTIAAEGIDEAGWSASFNTAFRAGSVMGFSLTSIAMLMLGLLIYVLNAAMGGDVTDPLKDDAKILFECVAGYGLGGSCIAMFGRVGGGIYTKAADVGADLAGKVVSGIPEDDPRNPATIADNVGDNVGDVAGMGSDLFGSYAESSCAALVVAAGSADIVSAGWGAILFPLAVSAVGVIICAVSSFLATDISPVKKEEDVETVLKIQLGVTAILMCGVTYPLSIFLLPETFFIGDVEASPLAAWSCIVSGLLGGCIVGFITEYYTSHSYTPVREVAQSCETGAATNIIYGLALGYKSAIIPITIIAVVTFVAFSQCGMYGVALGALGFLGTLATCLAIDVYGPVCDNAGGIAEMAELPSQVRDKTDALDAAGNTTAAIGKGFAIGSAALVSLALFGGFITRVSVAQAEAGPDAPQLLTSTGGLDVLSPITFAMLFMGAMIPYWFTALTMKSVGTAAMAMVKEVARQFAEIPGLLQGTPGHGPPDHAKCIKISTDASLKEMIAPGLLVILSPIIVGTLLGVRAVAGLLVGSLVSGVQLAISQSNTGGAWDNAKKYVEKGCVSILVDGEPVAQRKGSELHKAAVCGDTVGDPLKDTSGPAINIVMKLQAIISLVFADYFMSINGGKGLFNVE